MNLPFYYAIRNCGNSYAFACSRISFQHFSSCKWNHSSGILSYTCSNIGKYTHIFDIPSQALGRSAYRDSSLLRRILWLLIFIIASGYTSYGIIDIIKMYTTGKVTTATQVGRPWSRSSVLSSSSLGVWRLRCACPSPSRWSHAKYFLSQPSRSALKNINLPIDPSISPSISRGSSDRWTTFSIPIRILNKIFGNCQDQRPKTDQRRQIRFPISTMRLVQQMRTNRRKSVWHPSKAKGVSDFMFDAHRQIRHSPR